MKTVGTCGMMVALGAVLTLGACASPPRGQQNNRVEVSDTTAAERSDPRVSTAEMGEFEDQVVAQLTEDLRQVPELNEYRSTIVFGNLINKTGIVSTTDFEKSRAKIRAKLLQSRYVLQNVRFIESKDKWAAARNRELDEDVLQERGGAPKRNLNEQYTFFLDGEMYRVERGGGASNLYAMTFQLTRAGDSEIVWSSAPYESKRVLR